jgi:hypothetical protein
VLLLEAIKREQERIVLWAKGFLERRAQAADEIAAYVAARKRREANLEVAQIRSLLLICILSRRLYEQQ